MKIYFQMNEYRNAVFNCQGIIYVKAIAGNAPCLPLGDFSGKLCWHIFYYLVCLGLKDTVKS